MVPIEGTKPETEATRSKKAFKQMGGKPDMLYSEAKPGLTSNKTQAWFKRQQHIAQNITLRRAPLAERMIGYIKNQIIHTIRCANKAWWDVVGAVVQYYNKNQVSRSRLMTPNGAAKKDHQTQVKTQLESSRKSDNPQPRIDEGDKVRVVVKKKFEKGYMPEWSDEVYTVQRVSKGHNAAPLTYISYQPIMDRQGMYLLNDPNNTLNNYKNGMFTRSEHLLFEKALIL